MHAGDDERLRVHEAILAYAAGAFPMDMDPALPEIPWYTTDRRAVFELDAPTRNRLRRRVRRSLRAVEGFPLRLDTDYEAVLARCARPRAGEEDVWISPRLKRLYRALHRAGVARSFELWTPDGRLAAGIIGVTLGRAAILESMSHEVPHAGNALLSRTLDLLAARHYTLCDIQTPTDHTLRLGATLVPDEVFRARLRDALAGG